MGRSTSNTSRSCRKAMYMPTKKRRKGEDPLKGLFLEACRLVKKKRKQEEAFRRSLEEMGLGGRADVFLYSEYEELVFRLLKPLLGFEEGDDAFDVWFYDWEMGDDFCPGDYEVDSELVDLTTPLKFYELFVENPRKKEEK